MDANFLYIETHKAPMHYLLIGVVEGEITYEELAAGLIANLEQLPGFKQKILPNRFRLLHPTWEPDPHFSIERHLFEIPAPPHGSDDELLELAAKISAGVMDYGKPLWEMYLVNGLSGDRAALIVKLHHAMADGSKALELVNILVRSPGTPLPRRSDHGHDVAVSNGNHNGAASRSGMAPLSARLSQSVRKASFVTVSIAKRRRALPFNRNPSGERVLCHSQFSLAEAQAICAAHGGSMSDLTLSVFARGVRRYLEFHKHPIGRRNLRVMFAVNLRRKAQNKETANLASVCPIDIPLRLSDPLECLQFVAARSKKIKETRVAEHLDSFLTVLGKVPVPVQFWTAVMARNRPTMPYNVIVTNVSSPRSPQQMFGRRALGLYAFPTIPYGIGVSCALLEHNDRMNLFLSVDAQSMPDARRLQECLDQSFAELRDAAGVMEGETLSDLLRKEPEASRYELLQKHVRRHVAAVLNWHDEQQLDPQQGFFDLGMDSLAALELRDRLQTALGEKLPSTLIFDTPNTDALTNYLATEMFGWENPISEQLKARPADTQHPHHLLESIQHLSDDEVDRLLAKAAQ
jgi:WS/DGAT/MGAT family acyltransferase